MTVYILEKPVLGGSRRLLAADVFMFLQNASRKVCVTVDTWPVRGHRADR